MKKGTLTLKEMDRIYKEASKYSNDEFIIPWWKYPLLWLLPVWKVEKTSYEKLIYKKWGNVIYLVKTEDL